MRAGLYRGVGGKLASALGLIAMLASCRPTELASEAALPPAIGAAAEASALASRAPLIEIRWLAPQADLVAELTTEPAECLGPPLAEDDEAAREVGRAAFRAPGLLGGQAARAGLSCASCHRNGRGNPAFAFPGVSGEPGTADVTASFFSSHRGDGMFNPVPIPDLAGPPELLKVDRARDSGVLEGFIRGLIVEEFDGPEPPPRVLAGLAAYVRGLSPEACPAEQRRTRSVEADVEGASSETFAALIAYSAGDAATADLLIGAARTALGRIHERYPGTEHKGLREALVASSAELLALQRLVRDGADPSAVAGGGMAWKGALDDLAPALQAAEPRSLYAQDVLSRALAARPE